MRALRIALITVLATALIGGLGLAVAQVPDCTTSACAYLSLMVKSRNTPPIPRSTAPPFPTDTPLPTLPPTAPALPTNTPLPTPDCTTSACVYLSLMVKPENTPLPTFPPTAPPFPTPTEMPFRADTPSVFDRYACC
jgi:hypothetical protein